MNIQERVGFDFEHLLHKTVGNLVLDKMTNIPIETISAAKHLTGNAMSLYVHIPFCTEICSFCAFHRRVGNRQQQETYTGALETHIDDVLTPLGKHQKISSVFVGGGTPGLLSVGQADRILTHIKNSVDTDGAQVSYELHPENVSEEYLEGLQEVGVGRFSIGV